MSFYSYPVKSKQQARIVTQPDFEPDPEQFRDQLYVNLDAVRPEDFRQEVLFTLGIEKADDEIGPLEEVTYDYTTIIVSGHRGCGKTTELRRLHRQLDHPTRYCSVFLSIEEEMEYGSFQPEDLFVWMIIKLAQTVEERRLPTSRAALEQLARQLLTDKVIEEEMRESFETELSAEGESGFDFWWVKFATKAKAVFAGTNQTSTRIRENVRRNTLAVIDQINRLLIDVRGAVEKAQQGRDLLLIVDGSEKLKFEVYQYLFVQNAHLLKALQVNLLIAVPISSFYEMRWLAGNDFPNQLLVPMIQLGAPGSKANECFKEIVGKRIDEPTFFEAGVLDACVLQSGGCARQLLRIVHQVIIKASGNRATLPQAEAVFKALGSELRQVLDERHVAALRGGLDKLELGNEAVRDMLLRLVVLKYNGHLKLNPLLRPFFPELQA